VEGTAILPTCGGATADKKNRQQLAKVLESLAAGLTWRPLGRC